MASTFQQQSTIRKFIYFGLILALFTGSLLHRKMIINAQADQLQMRESARGKADLTDSALRLTLSGVRGVAVTSLWLAAIERQKRHEWNELEVLVDSLTRLQPRFTSPWLFQGWNLAFNVSVECDRPRDKYYYITRGITLLIRGEEKNDPGMAVPPQPWPASPEMRFQVGFSYQLKIGQGDEHKTQRCLFEMSTIPFKERDPESFWKQGKRGKEIDLAEFMKFCKTYPRMVRRLKERLTGFSNPEDIVAFLTDNKDVPGRLEDRSKLNDDMRLEEFPILPPQHAGVPVLYQYPNWRNVSLSTANEDFDVYTCMRAWYAYAQLPLPKENPDLGLADPPVDRQQFRLPKMATIIFRSYPARAQAYYGEHLQLDGWFDDSGWLMSDWFDDMLTEEQKQHLGGLVVGDGERFHSGKAWGRAYEMYKYYGERNGMYLDDEMHKKLQAEALEHGGRTPASDRIQRNKSNRGLTNYDMYIFQTNVERTPEAVAARKAIFEANRIRLAGDSARALRVYREEAMPQWLDLLLRYSHFRNISIIQEDTYELQADYFKLVQFHYKKSLEKLVIGGALCPPLWPQPGWVVPLIDPAGAGAAIWPQKLLPLTVERTKLKLFPIRDVEGLFDQTFMLDNPRAEVLKPLAQALARQALWPPLPTAPATPDFAFARYVVWPADTKKAGPPEIGLGSKAVWPPPKLVLPQPVTAVAGVAVAADWPRPLFLMLNSAEQRRTLTVIASHRHPPEGQGWTPLIPSGIVEQVRGRIPWMRPRPVAPATPGG